MSCLVIRPGMDWIRWKTSRQRDSRLALISNGPKSHFRNARPQARLPFAKQARERGASLSDAAVEAARLRLRPIVMTSFAFILGVVPLMVGTGAGYEMRQSLGTAVFFGMLGVTIFGLFFTPVFYVVAESLGDLLRKKPADTPTGNPATAEQS